MLGHFLTVALSFPSVVYTVLVGIALAYWLFVMIGAAQIDMLGDGSAGAADGHFDAGDASAHHGIEAAHPNHGADAADEGGLTDLLAALHLRRVPSTVMLSVLVLFSWLLSVLGMQSAIAHLSPDAVSLARYAILLLAPILSLPLTSIAVRPLARIFLPPTTTAHPDLIGKVCTVRTGTVTDRFGEAMLEDGGAGLVVRIRVDAGETVKRGDQVVILGYDEERHEFTVAPAEDLLKERVAK